MEKSSQKTVMSGLEKGKKISPNFSQKELKKPGTISGNLIHDSEPSDEVKKDKKGKKKIFDRYNEMETKGNIKNTLVKSLVDVATSAVGGTFLGALTGKHAFIVGLGLIATGHYTGDKTGLLRVLGAGMVAHGIAKGREYRQEPQPTVKERIVDAKDMMLVAFHLDKVFNTEARKRAEKQKEAIVTQSQNFTKPSYESGNVQQSAAKTEQSSGTSQAEYDFRAYEQQRSQTTANDQTKQPLAYPGNSSGNTNSRLRDELKKRAENLNRDKEDTEIDFAYFADCPELYGLYLQCLDEYPQSDQDNRNEDYKFDKEDDF